MGDSEKKDDMEITLVSQLDTKKPLYQLAGKPPKIQTKIDRLLEIIKQKERIKISEAAKMLGVPEDTVREWGEILEEHKMIELHYPITGKPSLGIIRPKVKRRKGEKKEEKKPKGLGIPEIKRFTFKRMMINVEIIVFGLLFIYVFFINRYLAVNFIPTVRFHAYGFMAYLQSLPGIFATMNFPRLVEQPLYLGILVLIVALIVLAAFSRVRSGEPKPHVKEEKPKEEKKEEREPKKEEKKEEVKEKPRETKEKKHEKKEEKKEEKPRRDDAVFADIIERYKRRLQEMEK